MKYGHVKSFNKRDMVNGGSRLEDKQLCFRCVAGDHRQTITDSYMKVCLLLTRKEQVVLQCELWWHAIQDVWMKPTLRALFQCGWRHEARSSNYMQTSSPSSDKSWRITINNQGECIHHEKHWTHRLHLRTNAKQTPPSKNDDRHQLYMMLKHFYSKSNQYPKGSGWQLTVKKVCTCHSIQ